MRFIELQQAAGYKFETAMGDLRSFGAFADAHGDEYVKVEHVLKWAATARSPRASRRRLLHIRRFALMALAEDSRHEVPPADAFGAGHYERRIPHIYSPDEIFRLREAAAKLKPSDSFRRIMYPFLFGLIYATGIRISEALALKISSVTDDGLIILQTKFRKSRMVPLHDTTKSATRAYLSVRMTLATLDDSLFVLDTGSAPAALTVQEVFRKLTRSIGLKGAPSRPEPRIHDMRHSFAVHSLEQCPHDPVAIARHLAALSTYLGHAHVTNTYWYLQATPLLMTQIAEVSEASHHGGAA